MKIKNILKSIKKFWSFIWDGNSIYSWILSFIIAYIIIKFIFFPTLEFFFHTDLPLVAVVSGSMDHRLNNQGVICGVKPFDYHNNFDDYWKFCGRWYEQRNITKRNFEKFPFKNGFHKGDIMIIYNPGPEKIKIGDVIVFDSLFLKYPVIHRVINKTILNNISYFETKGDHNGGQNFDEFMINQKRVHGKAIFRIPYLGYPKIWLFELLGKLKV